MTTQGSFAVVHTHKETKRFTHVYTRGSRLTESMWKLYGRIRILLLGKKETKSVFASKTLNNFYVLR